MMPVKIVFFDIDGTLVDPKTGRISQRTRQTIQQLRANGIRLCIVTGRAPVSLPDFGDLVFDVLATFNGCLCRTAAETIYANPIAPEDVRKVLQNAAAIGRPVAVATQNRLAANGIDPDLADYYRLAGLELTIAPDFEEVRKEEIYQILVGCRDAEHAAIVRGAEGVKLAISWDRAVDVIPATGGKGKAVQRVLDYFHLDRAEAIAFGDGLNDMEMLQTVGTGIAMGNAAPGLKAAADRVCGCVSEDGIYHYCMDNGLL